MMRVSLKLKVLFQVFLLALIAAVSGLDIPSFAQSSWDIVLFLTPLGILKNLLAASPVLRSFYLDISPGQTPLTFIQASVLILLYILAVVNGLHILRALEKK